MERAYINQSQFSRSKSVKIREAILLAISLTGIGASLCQPKSVFKIQKRKIRETILLAITFIGIGAYINQDSFQVPKR